MKTLETQRLSTSRSKPNDSIFAPASRMIPWRVRHFFASRLGVLPDFLIPGFPKCGTTSLFEYLAAHPDIYPPLRKEIWYFSGQRYDQQADHLCWYKGHFPSSPRKFFVQNILGKAFMTGEASPDYLTYHKNALPRMASLVPGARIIILMRNPIHRTYSYYQHERRSGREKRSFQEVLEQEFHALDRANGSILYTSDCYTNRFQRDSYLITSLYVNYLELLYKAYPKDNILIVKSEDMFESPTETFRGVLTFLGLRHVDCGEGHVHNKGRYDSPTIPEYDRLSHYIAPYNERLYRLIDRDMDWK